MNTTAPYTPIADSDIWVTGIGLISALGCDPTDLSEALAEGEPALERISLFEPPAYCLNLGGEIPDFDPEEFLETPKAYLDRQSALFLSAATLALSHAGLQRDTLPADRTALLAGTAWGGLDTMQNFFRDFIDKGPRLVKPFLFPHTYANTAISLAAIDWEIQGPHLNFAAGRIASNHALAAGFDLLRAGDADIAIVAGAEALTLPRMLALHHLDRLIPAGALSPALTPFDQNRRGTLVGEAATVLILERAGAAEARGATPLARLCAVGLAAAGASRDAEGHAAAEALGRAIQGALGDTTPPGGLAAVAAVVAGACGALADDRSEAEALERHIAPAVPISAPLGLTGDLGGTSGLFQCACALRMLTVRAAPPIAGLMHPELTGLNYVVNTPTALRPGPILVTTLAPGGDAAATLFALPQATSQSFRK